MSTLTKQDIIRAWKDADFRNQLSDEQRAALPKNPAGVTELTSAELTEVSGGASGDGWDGRTTHPTIVVKPVSGWETKSIACENTTLGGNHVISS